MGAEEQREATRFRRTAWGLVLAKLLVHLVVLGRWGIHRDELYFISCARRLAVGYADHPPLIAWITAVFGGPTGEDLRALRLAPALAGAATMTLTCAMVRALGGGASAALVAGASVLVGPFFLRSGSLLCIPAFEPALWTAAALLVVKLEQRASPRLWIALGLVVGAGMLTKHSMLLWAVGLALGAAAGPLRPVFATPWPWLAMVTSALVISPNVVWQIAHDWPSVDFARELSRSVLAQLPRPLFVAGIVLYMNPVAAVVWGWGLVAALRRSSPARSVGIAFVVTFAALLATRAKPYYLAGAFPALFAVGAVAIERAGRVRARWPGPRALAVMLLGSLPPFALISLPIVRVDALDRALEPLVGWAVPPRFLTGELHDQFAWREHADAVDRATRGLEEAERGRAVVLAHNYGQASAVELLGADDVPVASPHMEWWRWGLPADRAVDTVMAIGFERRELEALFRDVREVDRSGSPLAWVSEQDVPIFVGRDPIESLQAAWPRLRRYGHGRPANDYDVLRTGDR